MSNQRGAWSKCDVPTRNPTRIVFTHTALFYKGGVLKGSHVVGYFVIYYLTFINIAFLFLEIFLYSFAVLKQCRFNINFIYMSKEIITRKCIICGKEINLRDSHNAAPIISREKNSKNRCCTDCNDNFVLPTRMGMQIPKWFLQERNLKLIPRVI